MKMGQTKEKDSSKPVEVLIFACSGGTKAGQIANHAARDLNALGKGRMYCLAGIGAHDECSIENARAAKRRIVIDGCPIRCGRKTLEHAGLKADIHVVVTELGIQDSREFLIELDEIQKVVNTVLTLADQSGQKRNRVDKN